MPQPTLRSDRLILRPFIATDASKVQRYCGEKAIADTTLNIPHPYEDGMAEAWIATHQPAWEAGELATFAVTTLASELVAAVGLRLEPPHRRGELGYWVGVPYWGQGYATEAAAALVAWGFDILDLQRIHAAHFSRNPASGRVMQKIGMTFEGIARQHVLKNDRWEDMARYGMVRGDPRPGVS